MTKRLLTSLTQRLSGSRSIRACSERRSFGRGARGFEFGDVLMRRRPSRRRASAGGGFEWSVRPRSSVGPESSLPGGELFGGAKRQIVVGGRRAGSGGDAKLDDLAQRRARANLLGRKAIDFREAAIAQDQPLLAVEESKRLARNGVEGGLVALRLRLERRDPARSSRSTTSNEPVASFASVVNPLSSGFAATCVTGFARNYTSSASAIATI